MITQIFSTPFLHETSSYANHQKLKSMIQKNIEFYASDRFLFYGTGYTTAGIDNDTLKHSDFGQFITQKASDMTKNNMTLEKIWVNINPQGAYQARHMHPEYELAGTYYVFCPINSGNITFYHPSPVIESLQLIKPYWQFTQEHKPKEEDLLIWPGYIQHEVSYNYTTAVRLTISFCLNSKR